VKKMAGGGEDTLVTISKTSTIEELKAKILDRLGVSVACQRLFYRGKQLENEQTLFDYSINVNEVIQLMERQPLAETTHTANIAERLVQDAKDAAGKEEEKEKEKPEKIVEDAESEFYLVGDKVDIMDTDPDSGTPGAWFEGEVARVTREEGEGVVAGEDGLTYYVKYEAYDGDDYRAKVEHLKPRACRVLKAREVEVGMEVLVPYNVTDPSKRGEWYTATVEAVRPELVVTVLAGVDRTPIPECRILHPKEVMAVEAAVAVSLQDGAAGRAAAVERQHPEKCEVCHDSEKKKCKECGCNKCGGKEEPELQVVCDECQMAFHLACIKLAAMPEEDEWFCKDCKNIDDTVKLGEKIATGKKKSKMASKQDNGRKERDWGKGFATVGRTKTCSKVTKNHFGPIPGVEVGMSWLFRLQVSEEGIHRPHVAGIAGTAAEGCPSLVLGGGYEDDEDHGDWFTYTGSGGRDLSGNKRTAPQSSDQELTRTNAAIAVNCNVKFDDKKGGDAGEKWREGKPIRVVRGYKGAKHSKFAPTEGCRYDGIYKVVKYWPQKGKAGFIIWRYELRRDDPAPPPWTKEGRKRMEEGGYSEIVKPENHDEFLKLKAKEKEEKEAKKLAEKGEKAAQKGKGKKRKADEEEDEAPKEKEPKGAKASKVKESKSEKKAEVAVSYKMGSEEKALVNKDKKNKKLWQEVMEGSYKNKKEMTDKVEEVFCCIICQDVVCQPVTTPCGHNVCQACLGRSFKAGVFSCPSCRAEMDKDYEKPINQELKAALNTLFPGYEIGR